MLVLGTNIGEYVVIDDRVVVRVIRLNGDIKLAIDAPKEMPIVRGEVYERTHPRPAVIENDRRHYSLTRKNCAATPKPSSP